MFRNLHLGGCKWVEETSKSNEDFTKSYHDNSDEGCFLEVDVQYPENLYNLHNDLPSFPERMKTQKVEKLVERLHGKEEYVMHRRYLKEALNHGLILKKVHRVINFNQESWIKRYIDMSTGLRKKSKKKIRK